MHARTLPVHRTLWRPALALPRLALAFARPALALVAALALGPVAAQTPQISGRTEALFGVAVDGSLPVASAELVLRLDGEVGSGFFPEAAYTASIAVGHDAATGATRLELDEAHATLFLTDVDITVGKQRRSWGSTDGVNPVDVLNPRDLTFPPANEKIAVPMLYGAVHAGDARVQLAVVPLFTPSRLPGDAWRPTPALTLPPGVSLVGVLPPEMHEPAAELGNVQFGARATLEAGAFDVSATYFNGWRTEPTASAKLLPTGASGQFQLQPVIAYDRMQLVGLDFSGTIGPVVVRGEAAYELTADWAGTDPQVGNHSLQAVLGAEYLVPAGPRVVIQGIFDYTAPDAGQNADTAFKVMTVLAYQAGARTNLDLAWMQSLDGSGLVMPAASYTFADGVVGEAKAYVFYGGDGDGSEFGGWKGNSQMRVSVAYSF